MKKRLFLGACLVALASSPTMAQTGAPQVVVVSLNTNPLGKTHLVLAYADGRTEEQEVKNMSNSDKAQHEATVEYQRVIAKLYQQGYALKSTFMQYQGQSTTLVFVKG